MIKTKVVKIEKDQPEFEKIKQAIDVLGKGGLVAFPTETVYGLGANFKDKNAITKLYQVKNRPNEKPFTFLIGDIRDIDDYASDVLPFVYRLADRFWPGPLTIVLRAKLTVLLKSINSSTIGLRIPKSKIALEIVRGFDFPLVCPSANLSGKRSPLNAKDVLEDLQGKIDLVLDGGQVELGVASTVVDACNFPPKILRHGFIDEKLIQEIAAKKRILFVCTGNSCRSVMAKALLEKKLKERARNDIEVFSAGIAAPIGLEASFETQELLKEEGIDVSNHHAQRMNEELVKRSDLILVMERFQEEAILKNNPFLKNRLYLLREFSRFSQDNLEIEDPIGKGMLIYRKSFSKIKEAVDKLVDLI